MSRYLVELERSDYAGARILQIHEDNQWSWIYPQNLECPDRYSITKSGTSLRPHDLRDICSRYIELVPDANLSIVMKAISRGGDDNANKEALRPFMLRYPKDDRLKTNHKLGVPKGKLP